MARRRFLVDTVHEGRAELAGEDAHHLARVLRAETGQRFELSDGITVYLGEIENAAKGSVQFRIVEELETPEPLRPLTLYMALIKFDRLEWAIEKATELGVTAIVPVNCARSEEGFAAAAVKRSERWRKIARESAQQSRRVAAPEIGAVRRIASLPGEGLRCRLEEETGSSPLGAILDRYSPSDSLSLLVGPEGGWTDAEREKLDAAAWQRASLGPLILRAETAAIAALAVSCQWRS